MTKDVTRVDRVDWYIWVRGRIIKTRVRVRIRMRVRVRARVRMRIRLENRGTTPRHPPPPSHQPFSLTLSLIPTPNAQRPTHYLYL